MNIPKSTTNLDFHIDVLHRTAFKYYEKSKFCTAKKVTPALREK
jgi:hypothetical protein